MWTGVYPTAHGIIDNVYGIDNAFATVSRVRETVFDRLGAAGYLRAHFGKWHLGEVQPPFFDVWEECFNSRRGHWIGGRLDGAYRPDRQTDAMIGFLERAPRDRPFVAVQGYYPPHDPYSAPLRFYAPYRGRGIPFAGYYAAVSALDWNLGRIRDALARTGLAANTVLVYYSDHGDTFWYRREGEHKFVCTDDAIRVPMIVEGPDVAAGARCAAPVGLQDLAPTLLDLAGAAVPDGLHGRSLRPLLAGHTLPWRDDTYVQNVTHISGIEQRALRTGRWKLIAAANGAHELYDLEADPEEELDVFLTPRPDGGFERFTHYPDFAPVIADLARRMTARAEEIGDARGGELAGMVEAAIAGRL
jgi:choline-sulfatase